MLKAIERKVKYEIGKEDKLKFKITNYTRAKTFSSFFPGIAGLLGIPLWCFYVNRGQGIISFGTENKDGAIMEFQPANKAYRLVSTHGFRTFIKYKKDGTTGYYEPFQESQSSLDFEIENSMTISPYDLVLEETNKSLGLLIEVRYFTVPNEPVAALAREVRIKNMSCTEVGIEVLDGMSVIIPYGMVNEVSKNMSRTIEAWTYVENREKGVPFYRLKTLSNDSSEVITVKAGNFYMGFYEEDNKVNLLKPIIDPTLIFGHALDLIYPYGFAEAEFNPDSLQHFENRTPSAMGYAKFKLEAGVEKTLSSIIGHAGSVEELNKLYPEFFKKGYFETKAEENKKLVRQLMDNAFVCSSSDEFDSYCRQSFLDNLLRGGYPLTIKSGDKNDVLYVYSRRHGDLERDYNAFRLMPTYFSQGNGAYRDINQNRRNDAWFNPEVGYSNILYFMNLIQLDGYNPLVVKGLSYIYNSTENSDKKIKGLIEEKSGDKLLNLLKKPFIPHNLIQFIEKEKVELKVSLLEFISTVLLESRKLEDAEHGEGYWSDHWFYNLDLLESFEGLYPDKMKELLTNDKLFTFYDDCYYIAPRAEKHVLHNGEPRQFGSVKKNSEKLKLIKERDSEPYRVRTNNGKGSVYNTSLLVKLLSLCVNKIASLDANGAGIEMEADKPNWDDALNGLPGLFGSSVSETFELKRLVMLLDGWIESYGLENEDVKIPEEIYEFFNNVYAALKKDLNGNSSNDSFAYWDASYTAKEAYRAKVLFGITGKEEKVSLKVIKEFLKVCLSKLEAAKEKAFNKKLGIYNTYFINRPEEYDLLHPEKTSDSKAENARTFIKVKKFNQIPLPPFLEGQVHALKIEKDAKKIVELCNKVRESDLYDKKLGMYKVNASLEETPVELGRIRVFTPGWLENESVFMHMEHKYLLELMKCGQCEQYFSDADTALVPNMKPEVYGRSIFENSSFISSSANPDVGTHGGGYVARLSGTTSEFYHIQLVMALGKRPFVLNGKGELELKLSPSIHADLFTKEEKKVIFFGEEDEKTLTFEMNTYSMNVFGKVILVYHNPKRLNTYGEDGVRISRIVLSGGKAEKFEINGGTVQAPYALKVRDGVYDTIDVWLE